MPAQSNMDSSNTTAASGPKTYIRLFLRASNLPTSIIAQGYRQPDTFARVSLVKPHQTSDVASPRSIPELPTGSPAVSHGDSLEEGEASDSDYVLPRAESQHGLVLDEKTEVRENLFCNSIWRVAFCQIIVL